MHAVRVPPARPAGPADAELLAALHAQCFGPDDAELWDGPAVASFLGTPGILGFLAVDVGEAPVGLIVFRIGGGESEILTIGVLPTHRRRGHGQALVDAAARHAAIHGAEALFLEVAADNTSAQSFYRSSGFRPVGRRAGYYRRQSGRSDAIILRRILGSRADPQLSADIGTA